MQIAQKRHQFARPGEKNGRAKLTARDIELIRTLADGGMRQSLLAIKFEISKRVVGKICRYEIWNVTEE